MTLKKKCNVCNKNKKLTCFYHTDNHNDYHDRECKQCNNSNRTGLLKKSCQRCKAKKPYEDYYHNRTKPDYHNGICKECQKEINKKKP